MKKSGSFAPRSRASRVATLAAALVGLGSFATVASAQQEALILSDSGRSTVVEGAVELESILTTRGYTVDFRDVPFGGDPGDLSNFSCVWDLRADPPLQAIEKQRMYDYVRLGGSVYLAGENGFFVPRNSSIADLVNMCGGGPVLPSPALPTNNLPTDIFEATNPDHAMNGGCAPISQVDYDGVANGQFDDLGRGVWLTGAPTSAGAGAWSENMIFCTLGRIVSVLDVNWISPGPQGTLYFQVIDPTLPTENRPWLDNMITWLCEKQDPLGDCGCNPRNHGYWHRYCLGTDAIDPGRNGQGNGPGPIRDAADFPLDLLSRVDGDLSAYGIQACQALDEGPFSDTRLAALRELATLHFNLRVGYVSQSCAVELHPVDDTPDLTVGDALSLMESRLALGTADADRDARWIGEHVNNGEALVRE